MASHFSAIGFDLPTLDDFQALAEALAPRAERVDTSAGRYLRWRGAAGEEIWLQLDVDDAIVGMNPHLTGKSLVRVELTARVQRHAETVMDGAFHAWADPPTGAGPADAAHEYPAPGAYPFVFDTPDYGAYATLTVPAYADAQIAAFAHHVSAFDSPEAYETAQTSEAPLASRSFIPSGLFTPGGRPTDPPEALAILTGHVLAAERRVNEITGIPFFWAWLDTFGGTYDMVIARDLLSEVPPVGGVLSGMAWLSGRLVSFPRPVRSWPVRLLDA